MRICIFSNQRLPKPVQKNNSTNETSFKAIGLVKFKNTLPPERLSTLWETSSIHIHYNNVHKSRGFLDRKELKKFEQMMEKLGYSDDDSLVIVTDLFNYISSKISPISVELEEGIKQIKTALHSNNVSAMIIEHFDYFLDNLPHATSNKYPSFRKQLNLDRF